ncbi:phage tail tape measure protein, partial [bacterium]|nr:phage tail tape measure protein [bacterium]
RQLIKVAQVTGDNIGKLRGLTSTITNLSTGFGVASKDLLDVSTVLLQAGISAKDTEVALKSLAKAALAPNFDSISETAEGAIAILAQFGQGVNALEGQLSSINAVAGAFAVEASDLIDVIRRTGGVFKASGGSLNELLALFTSVRATTRESAESIGTGLRTIFTRIQRPKTIEFLKQFGVELVDLEGKFVGPFEAVRRLSGALSGLGERDITFIQIAEELGGFRQIGKVLPLLQQFSTAQAALNVATKSGNTLTNDAATAQQALAIRIVKVKEEFLALVRGITETSTFQIMANTALALASAFIKIAESIKPLLPLLGALVAVKLVKGIGGFLGGVGAGLTSGRAFNKGGRVHAFARGGLVPGVGDTDSVPAMLSPGEFVIKKSSVKSIGANNLHAMNKYAVGGVASKSASMALTGRKRLSTREMMKASQQAGYNIERLDNGRIALSRNGKIVHNNLTDDEASNLLASMSTGYAAGGIIQYFGKGTGQSGVKPLSYREINANLPADQALSVQSLRALKTNNATEYNRLEDEARKNMPAKNIVPTSETQKKRVSKYRGILNNNTVGAAILKGRGTLNQDITSAEIKGALQTKFKKELSPFQNELIPDYTFIKSPLQKENFTTFNTAIEQGLISAANTANSSLARTLEVPVPAISTGAKKDFIKGLNDSAKGNLFETILTSMTNKGIWDSDPDVQRPFDFPGGLTSKNRGLKELFPQLRGIRYVDSKASFPAASRENMVLKIANQILKDSGYNYDATRKQGNQTRLPIRRAASGGGVGTDTVPALLTPGEFVVNRSSAQRIGYGNLNRMNKVGKYANGGIVQHFAAGTSGGGVSDAVVDQAFSISSGKGVVSKLFSNLQREATKLADAMLRNAGELNTTTMALDNIAMASPQLRDSIRSNAIANGRGSLSQDKVVKTYEEMIIKMVNQGKSLTEIDAAMKKYVAALDKDTKQKNQASTKPANATKEGREILRTGVSSFVLPTTPRSGSAAAMGGDRLVTNLASKMTPVESSLLKFSQGLDKLTFGGFSKLLLGTTTGAQSLINLTEKESQISGVSTTLIDSIIQNSLANGRSANQHNLIVDKLATKIQLLQNSGRSEAEVAAVLDRYEQQIIANTNRLASGGSVGPLSGGG